MSTMSDAFFPAVSFEDNNIWMGFIGKHANNGMYCAKNEIDFNQRHDSVLNAVHCKYKRKCL